MLSHGERLLLLSTLNNMLIRLHILRGIFNTQGCTEEGASSTLKRKRHVPLIS